jgi:hypothetical protein
MSSANLCSSYLCRLHILHNLHKPLFVQTAQSAHSAQSAQITAVCANCAELSSVLHTDLHKYLHKHLRDGSCFAQNDLTMAIQQFDGYFSMEEVFPPNKLATEDTLYIQ